MASLVGLLENIIGPTAKRQDEPPLSVLLRRLLARPGRAACTTLSSAVQFSEGGRNCLARIRQKSRAD
jgi:hypothetical protein